MLAFVSIQFLGPVVITAVLFLSVGSSVGADAWWILRTLEVTSLTKGRQ